MRLGQVVSAWTRTGHSLAERGRQLNPRRAVPFLRPSLERSFRPQYVLALSKRMHPRTGRPSWYRISIPGRPNGRSGWLPAAAVELRPVTKRLVVDRSARRFAFWDHGRRLRTGKVAVGKPGAETPIGLFYVQSKFVPTTPILGAYAFETSAYSRLTDWPGGGVVGVHGTPWPWLLGQAVSHGACTTGTCSGSARASRKECRSRSSRSALRYARAARNDVALPFSSESRYPLSWNRAPRRKRVHYRLTTSSPRSSACRAM
jgi:L,D-transpeptidase catalytic domain